MIAGDSYLAQLAQYLGMVLVGLIIPILLKNKQKGYSRINQEEHGHDIDMASQMHCFFFFDAKRLNFIVNDTGTSQSSRPR